MNMSPEIPTATKGIPAVYQDHDTGEYYVKDMMPPSALDGCAYQKVFSGKFRKNPILVEHTFDEIRNRVRA